jgi:hypothetical protein
MKLLTYTATINAPKAKVWDTMLSDATYRIWTIPFAEGSYYEGSWEEGSIIKFIGPSDAAGENEVLGLAAKVVKITPHEYAELQHYGLLKGDLIDTESDMAKQWTPALESYKFTEQDGVTTVEVHVETLESEVEVFNEMWPKALVALKQLAEA